MKSIIEDLLEIIGIDEKIFKLNKEIHDARPDALTRNIFYISDRDRKIRDLARERGLIKNRIRTSLRKLP